MIKYGITNDLINYTITNDVIKYAIKNDAIKYAITNYEIKKEINNNMVFPNTPCAAHARWYMLVYLSFDRRREGEGVKKAYNINTSKLNKPLLCYVSICVYHYIHIIYIWSVSTQIPPNTPLTADIFSFIKHLLQTHRLLCISGYDIHIIIMKLPHSNNCQGTV